jgi:hypothetical protein
MFDRQIEPFGPDANDEIANLGCKVRFLSRPVSYTPAPETVTARETHISWVFCD